MPQQLRVFVSSPGDVPDERLRADLVVDKVAQDFGRFFTFRTYRWEHEPMLASGHFQDAIDPPSKADIVILVLWSRLGTPLPEKTETREYRGIDGRAPVTGTEWEYEDALRAARDRGAPDILAFRNVSPATVDTRDPVARERSIEQLDALDLFWKRHFADRGVFLAAYDEYQTLDEFARRLEESLRKLIERRVAALTTSTDSHAAVWPGAPFRGLQPYEFEHAEIFFGRDGLVAKAAEQLAVGARTGAAFLLVTGPSGSGKSSLVKAALVPRLMKPQRIQGAAFLRRAIFRPGDGGGDVILGLVEALTRGGEDGVGLPEMLAPGQDAAKLAAHLRAAVDEPGFVFAGALGHLTQDGRRDGRLLAFEEAKLILVIDQLEELFTASAISAADRQLLVRLIGNLARSGAVWIVATLRADFWHRAAEMPELVALAQGTGRLDVSPPSPAELAEMIRKPAQAAGLGFEVHAETGLGLDAVLAEHAANEPGVLPLLSFTLDALYAKDIVKDGGRILTFATYQSLGGLEGAIATRADEIVAGLPAAAQAAVPRVLRALATISSTADQVTVARTAPLANFPDGSAARQVVDALIAARLLVASDENAKATVRLAHEALISHWQRARDQLVADARDLQTRALIERQQERWTAAAGRARQQLLLRDPDLANAADLSRRWGDEIDPATRNFIQSSQRRARLRQQLTAAAAVVFALVAVAAVYGGYRARQERNRAERNYAGAKQAVTHLITDVADGLTSIEGVRAEALTRVLATVKKTVADLAATNPNDEDLQGSTALMLRNFADAYRRAGDLDRAREEADESLVIFRKLAAEHPDNQNLQFFLSDALNRLAAIGQAAGDHAAALAADQESLEIRRRLVEADPGNPMWQGAASINLNLVASLRAQQGDIAGALATYEDGLALFRKLAAADPQNPLWQSFKASALTGIGDMHLAAGDRTAALAAYDESIGLNRRLVESQPANTTWQAALALGLGKIANLRAITGDRAAALAAHEESLDLRRRLAASDPSDVAFQSDLSAELLDTGNLLLPRNPAEALADFQNSLDIRRKLAALDPENPQRQFLVSLTLNQLGNAQARTNDRGAALASYEEGLAILQKLIAANPGNGLWQRAAGIRLDGIGDVKAAQGDRDDARTAYDEGAEHFRKAVAVVPGNLAWRIELALNLQKSSLLSDHETARAHLREALAILEPLGRDGKLTPMQQGWIKSIQDKLAAAQ